MAKITNQDVAAAFAELADLMELLGEDGFRVNSYRKVSRVVEEAAGDVAALAAEGKLTDLPGVGKSSAEKIAQLVETGKLDLLEELRGRLPAGLPELLGIPGLGPKTIAKLWKQGGIVDKAGLAEAIEEGAILTVEGMGKKKAQQIWDAMKFASAAGERSRLGEATELAEKLIEAVNRFDGVEKTVAAGSLRRGKETIGDLDLLCQASQAKAQAIIDRFTQGQGLDVQIGQVLAAGKTKGSVRVQAGMQVDLRVAPQESFGAALAYFTGSKEHNIRLREIAQKKGLKLNEYGLFDGDKRLAGASEEEIYARLGLACVPPELREDRGEVEAALADKLPKLLELADIRGDLHMHTTASDGVESIETMIDACRRRGYKYMAISEHSKSQVQAHGLDAKRLAEHGKAVRAAAKKAGGITVYYACEVDIFKDGALDFSDEVLATLDFVTASPHSALSQKRDDATRRIIKAIENPYVRVIGHASGRLIGTRPGMELGIEEIVAAAAEHDVAMEINAHPFRLDLRDTHVRAAVEAGAKLVINSDSHGIPDLDNMKYGVITARRGWATAADVINAWTPARLAKWIKRQ